MWDRSRLILPGSNGPSGPASQGRDRELVPGRLVEVESLAGDHESAGEWVEGRP